MAPRSPPAAACPSAVPGRLPKPQPGLFSRDQQDSPARIRTWLCVPQRRRLPDCEAGPSSQETSPVFSIRTIQGVL